MLVHLLQSLYPKSNYKIMVEQTNDVLSFFNVFEKTCTLHMVFKVNMWRNFAKFVK